MILIDHSRITYKYIYKEKKKEAECLRAVDDVGCWLVVQDLLDEVEVSRDSGVKLEILRLRYTLDAQRCLRVAGRRGVQHTDDRVLVHQWAAADLLQICNESLNFSFYLFCYTRSYFSIM